MSKSIRDSVDAGIQAIYAKQKGLSDNEAYPAFLDADGYLLVNITVGTISLSGTASTINNAVGNEVPVSLEADLGKTLTSSSGSLSATDGTLVVPNGTNKQKVFAFSLTTTSATEVTCIFHTGGLELWRTTLIAPAGAVAGANLAVPASSSIFQSRSGTGVTLSLSTAVLVHYAVSYYDEA